MRYIALLIFAISTLSCSNILTELGSQTRDEALLEDAKILMDAQNWTQAVAKFTTMSATFLATREVLNVRAKAHAGLCGMTLLTMTEDLIANLSTGNLFVLLMAAMQGATSATADECVAAEGYMLQIGSTPAERTEEENITLAFISFAKMGAIMAAFADETTPDGATDAGFDGCANNTAPGIPDAYATEVGTGFNIALASLSAAGGGSLGSDLISDLNLLCSGSPTPIELAFGNVIYDFCGVTDSASMTANQILGVRSVINADSSFGLAPTPACNIGAGPCDCTP